MHRGFGATGMLEKRLGQGINLRLFERQQRDASEPSKVWIAFVRGDSR